VRDPEVVFEEVVRIPVVLLADPPGRANMAHIRQSRIAEVMREQVIRIADTLSGSTWVWVLGFRS